MDNRKAVPALLGAVVGVMMGAGATHVAELVAFSGANPNAAKDSIYARPMHEGDLTVNARRADRRTTPVGTVEVSVPQHQAAPAQRTVTDSSHCDGLSGPRLSRCMAEAQEGLYYAPSQSDSLYY